MVQKRWQDWINLILGLWTFVSPWVFGFAAGTSAAAHAMGILSRTRWACGYLRVVGVH